jgi:macrolide-specific efflux system membrane fusion protein
VFIFLLVLAFFGYRSLTTKKEPEVTYKVERVTRGDIRLTILSTGVVQPENRLEIKPPIAGRVEKVLADEGDMVRKGQVLAWMSSSERAALLDAASAKGSAAVKEWEALLKPTPILAPISGAIIKRNVESGQTFTTGEAVFVMSDKLTVKARVDETDISQVTLKQKAMITLDAYPIAPMPAHVDKIAFEGTTVNNVTIYEVDVIPENTPNFMRSGMTANVTFEVETKRDILVVPANAIMARGAKSYVRLPIKNPEKEKIPQEVEIKTGITDGKQVEVTAGLNENDEILVPEFMLPEGDSSNSPFTPFGGRRPQTTRRPGP